MTAGAVEHGVVITVFSTASGVGKTLVAVNLAAEIARKGHRVCLVDLDLQFGDVHNFLQIEPELTLFEAQYDVEHPEFDATLYTESIDRGETRFFALTAPKLLEEAYNVSTPAVRKVLEKLQKEYDYLILDTMAAFNELNLMALDMSTLVAFIGIMDFLPTIKNMRLGCDTLHNIGYDGSKLRFVLNRSNAKTQIELDDVEALLGEKFTKVIPNDFRAARHSILTGQPLVLGRDLPPIAVALRDLAKIYTGDAGTEDGKQSAGGWLRKLFGR